MLLLVTIITGVVLDWLVPIGLLDLVPSWPRVIVGAILFVLGSSPLVRDSKVLDVKAGQPIRYPVEEKGRFEPVGVAKWINEKTILSSPYPEAPDDTGAGVELGHQ